MTYETWRISYQDSEQAARAAFEEAQRLRAAADRYKWLKAQNPIALLAIAWSRRSARAHGNNVDKAVDAAIAEDNASNAAVTRRQESDV